MSKENEEILRAILEKGGENAKKQAAEGIAQLPPAADDPPKVKQKKKTKGLKKVAAKIGTSKFFYNPEGAIVDDKGVVVPPRMAKQIMEKSEMFDAVAKAMPKAVRSKPDANIVRLHGELKNTVRMSQGLARSHEALLKEVPKAFDQFSIAIKRLTDHHTEVVEKLIKQNEELQDKVTEILTGVKTPTRSGGAVRRPKRGAAAAAVGGSRAARTTKFRNTARRQEVLDRAERMGQIRQDRNIKMIKRLGIAGGIGGGIIGAGVGAAINRGGPAAPGPTGTQPSAGAQPSNVPGMVKLTTPISKKEYVVAGQYANNFKGFVDELENNGYQIKSIGGYANRNIAGTGQKSFHSLGVAIDINPSTNPHLFDGRTVTDMPANVSALARKYGLGWGGDWRSSKDTMHFSMASQEGGAVAIDRSGVAPLPGAPATAGTTEMAARGAPTTAGAAPATPAGVPERAMTPSPGTPGAGAAPGDVVKVVESGAGYNVVQLADGSVEKRTGVRNWRNNNPGNVSYGAFAQRYGAIGTDGRFAIFPTYEHGRRAKEALLFESQGYAGMNIAQAINRYAPPFENNTRGYVQSVAAAAGVDPSTPLSQLSPQQRVAMLNAMEKVEGFRTGQIAKVSGPTGTATASAPPAAPQVPGVPQAALAPSAGTPNAPAATSGEKPQNVSFESGRVDVSKVDPELLKRFYAAAAEYGGPVRINSAYRGDDYQAQLWVRANVFREPGIYSPAKPQNTTVVTYRGQQFTVPGSGRGSSHGKGQALDVSPDAALDPYLRKHGLNRPFASFDPPHVELSGGSNYQAPSEPTTGTQVAGGPTAAPGASPTAAMGATMAAGSARQAMTDACNCGPGQMVIMNNNNTMIHTQTMYRRNSLSGNNRQPEPFNPLAMAAGYAVGRALRLF